MEKEKNYGKNYFGGYTREQYHNQDINWVDKHYDYAVHITDGGAIYLMQKDIETGNEYDLRVDGADLEQLINTIQNLKE